MSGRGRERSRHGFVRWWAWEVERRRRREGGDFELVARVTFFSASLVFIPSASGLFQLDVKESGKCKSYRFMKKERAWVVETTKGFVQEKR